MRRLCERPGCSGPASVSYGMDATERLVWIDSEPAVDPSRAGALCRRHADALRPPRGWTLDDRRDEVPRLLRVPENLAAETTRASAPRPAARRPRRNDDVPTADLFTDGPADDAVIVEAARERTSPPAVDVDAHSPDETRAIPWVPRLGGGVSDDVPRGRLLGRAFGRRDPEAHDRGD